MGEAELPVFRVGTNKKGVVALWVVMIASLSFGIYKNFTAIDKETVHERVVVERKCLIRMIWKALWNGLRTFIMHGIRVRNQRMIGR